MLKREKRNNFGYTYLDLMLSIAIIGILSALSIITFSSYQHNSDVRIATLKLASDIRQAQNYALGLKEFNGSAPSGGWGVFLQSANNNKYIIFADYNDGLGGLPDKIYNSNEKFLDINIGQAQINKMTVDNVNCSQVNITFLPPDPDIFICCTNDVGTVCTYKIATIELKGSANGSSATSSVSINNLGLVEVN